MSGSSRADRLSWSRHAEHGPGGQLRRDGRRLLLAVTGGSWWILERLVHLLPRLRGRDEASFSELRDFRLEGGSLILERPGRRTRGIRAHRILNGLFLPDIIDWLGSPKAGGG